MKELKLTIDLLPKGAWGNDFSRTLSQKDWDTIRNKCYQKANYKCEICGYKTNELDAHEVWDFDIKTKTQTLKNIIALCSRCHGVKHLRNSQRLGFGENAKKHFMKVNKVGELEFASHLTKAQMIFDERNKIFRWHMKADLSKFGGENYLPKIINPYNENILNEIKNDCSLLPRILNVTVDNYQGIITVECDRVNKIEWITNKVIKTAYSFGNFLLTHFSVKNLNNKNLFFKLYNNEGQTISKIFELADWERV